MNPNPKKSSSNGFEKHVPAEEEQAKIKEMRNHLGPLPEKLANLCTDDSISRYLRARNWHVKKAAKMLKETLKWSVQYKPEQIRWEEIAHEGETGKVYRSSCFDKQGRPVLVLRPSQENSKSVKGQIRYLVYCMENAVQNLPPDQEQMVWLIDFHGYSLANVSLKATQETAHVLQEHYPERLGVAILYNPPKFFEPFWKLVKPFLEPKTRNKVKFVYSDDLETKKILEDLFDMDQLETAFGGNSDSCFNIEKYAERMKEDDQKRLAVLKDCASPSLDSLGLVPTSDDVSENEQNESPVPYPENVSEGEETDNAQPDCESVSADEHSPVKNESKD
ncbi:PREDICTED: random slug protein 5 [Tarenaya hassleriana]|uniref:random slug protein 5 n=1 Tax=Tarenaya hassleriana TaxID=28532 RepID=UPI00053C2E46|nr:PREDICTED: random slug protein 5 [Tarenaya hassleriana]XP_010538953.1 PREDICTED: random slug protein 5 [Tarenaya hassleriana]XP_010538954.1 PREDICTED: random slug protein 5 [Tarenaya hassleriana]XP_010538955.1 PREDICTED: random slug protein 5 [Tarenaya hassleriana]